MPLALHYEIWLRRKDSNLRMLGSKPSALTNLATPQYLISLFTQTQSLLKGADLTLLQQIPQCF